MEDVDVHPGGKIDDIKLEPKVKAKQKEKKFVLKNTNIRDCLVNFEFLKICYRITFVKELY